MGNKNRRQFLRAAGATLTNAAAFPHLLTAVPGYEANFAGKAGLTSRNSTSIASEPQATERVPAETRIRGLMVDAARVPESLDYYHRVIDFCADWGLNTLHFRLADDQGTALRFSSVPNLVTHVDAFTPDQLKLLAEYGKAHAVDVIPELESFGHTGYITRSPAYAHLLDREPQGDSEFTGVIPVHPETTALFERLFREVAAIFPSGYLHGGCDEVNWGGSELSRKALQTRTRPQIWAEYLNALNRLAEPLGKQLIVWGDFVVHKEPAILGQLNKSIVIMDWNYWDTNPAQFRQTLDAIRAAGHRGIGAPGLISYRWGPRAGTKSLRNIDAFADAYFASDDPGSLGGILTNWVPSRYIQNSIWDGFAYAAVAFNDGSPAARASGHRRFVERKYGAQWNETWSEAFRIIYDAAPTFGEQDSSSPIGLRLPVPFSDEESLAVLLKNRPSGSTAFTRLRSLLVLLEPSVLKNLSDFRAFSLSVEYLEAAFWRESVMFERAAVRPIDLDSARLLIENIAERDRTLAEALAKDWDGGRSPDSAAKHAPLFGFAPKDQLLFQWQRAADFSASLALNPDRFYLLLKANGLT
jgi:Glycosyl hydrolase family 20, catalytic domain